MPFLMPAALLRRVAISHMVECSLLIKKKAKPTKQTREECHFEFIWADALAVSGLYVEWKQGEFATALIKN